ncbi:nitroreductase family protein [Chloroflexota bacterium]
MTIEYSELAKAIKNRRSVRQWQDQPVPEALLLEAVELATWSANAGNRQTWRFYVVLNHQVINALADAVETVAAEMRSWPEMENITPPPAPGAPPPRKPDFFRQAPAIIVAAANREQTPQDKAIAERSQTDTRAWEIREWRNTANPRLQSLAGAISLLLLALHQQGLGAIWMTGPTQAKGDIEKILKMPENIDALAVIPVGYAAETPVSRGRKPVSEICEIIR